MTTRCPAPGIVGTAVALVVGALALWYTAAVWRHGARWAHWYRCAAGSDGTYAGSVSGTVTADEQFTSPVEGDDAVLATWRAERWGGGYPGNSWNDHASGVHATPFRVEDDTCSVAVDLVDRTGDGDPLAGVDRGEPCHPAVTCEIATGTEALRHEPGEMPEHLRALAASTDFSEPAGATIESLDVARLTGTLRYFEETVSVGDELTVLGTVPEGRASHGGSTGGPSAEPPLVVSDRSVGALRRTFRNRLLLAAPFAVLLPLVALAMAAAILLLSGPALTAAALATSLVLLPAVVVRHDYRAFG